jgi:Zn-dependent protease with chaperone function
MNNSSLVTFREKLYFFIKLTISFLIYASIFYLLVYADRNSLIALVPVLFYLGIYIVLIFCFHGFFYGYILGNGILLNKSQLPTLYDKALIISEKIGLSYTPRIYILQNNGMLNAFASRFVGDDFIVLYSDIVDACKDDNYNALDFIIAHELAHVKRKHCLKRLILCPSLLVPFLGSAYSRACEYTCDRIAYTLCPHSRTDGLLILAGGKELYMKINAEEYIENTRRLSFWRWFAEILSSHPNLPKRVHALNKMNF